MKCIKKIDGLANGWMGQSICDKANIVKCSWQNPSGRKMSVDYKILLTLLSEVFHKVTKKMKNDGKPHAYLWVKERFIRIFQIREHLSLFLTQSFTRDDVED